MKIKNAYLSLTPVRMFALALFVLLALVAYSLRDNGIMQTVFFAAFCVQLYSALQWLQRATESAGK